LWGLANQLVSQPACQKRGNAFFAPVSLGVRPVVSFCFSLPFRNF
jgi:hypothetical protein